MDKIITIKKISDRKDNFIILNNELKYYVLGSGRIFKSFSINKLMVDDLYLVQVYNQGYDSYRKEFWNTSHCLNYFYIPITKNFLDFYQLNWSEEGYREEIVLSKRNLNNNVDSFYEFSLEVEIQGIRTNFNISNTYDAIYLSVPWNDSELQQKMTDMLGEPEIAPENAHDKFGRYSKNYIVPTRKIDKIIGVQRYRDTSSFCQENGEQFTGKTEEFVLDLHHFDENIYTLLREHGLLEIKEDAIVEIEKSDSEESETKKSVMEKPIEKNSFGQFVRNWMSKIFFLFDKSSS